MSFITTMQDLLSPILADRQIKKLYQKGQLIKTRLSDNQFQPNSVDLTLADTYSLIQPNCDWMVSDDGSALVPGIDLSLPIQYKSGNFTVGLFKKPSSYIVQPGEFVLMATREILSIPNGLVGFVQGRSSVARLSIQTEQAGLIDAGFEGTITLEVMNQSKYPIELVSGMRIAQVHFIKAKRADKLYSASHGSKYNGQVFATGSLINEDPEMSSGYR